MKVLLLHKYGKKAASFRYRFEQYLPALSAAGVEFDVHSLLDDDYLTSRFNNMSVKYGVIATNYLKRIKTVLAAKKYDLVIIYCECLPYFPAILERYLAFRKIPYIVDYDDAIFHSYDQNRKFLVRLLFGKKIFQVVKGARAVFAGNEYLASRFHEFNRNVVQIPTVVDLERYSVTKMGNEHLSGEFRIGWVGSPSTAMYLHVIKDALVRFCEKYPAKLVTVGAGKIFLPGIPLEEHEWSESTEIDDILTFDVGIMPLCDSPWSRGKCGFKLIQYMACGIPVIASPVGTNQVIIENGENGFLAANETEWFEALEKLYLTSEKRVQFGQNARKRVESEYSLQTYAPVFVESVLEAANTKNS